jgi:hypothetical protein
MGFLFLDFMAERRGDIEISESRDASQNDPEGIESA